MTSIEYQKLSQAFKKYPDLKKLMFTIHNDSIQCARMQKCEVKVT